MKSAIHWMRHEVGLDRAQIQTTEKERALIARHAEGALRAVEIGVYEGATSRIIRAALAPDGVLFAVDPFFRGRLGICWGRLIARKEVHAASNGNVVWIETLSANGAEQVSGKSTAFSLMEITAMRACARTGRCGRRKSAPGSGIVA